MFEMLGGFLGLLGWLFFAGRAHTWQARAAYLVGTMLYFTKYHYGLFLLSSLFVCTILEETPETRQRLWHALRPYLVAKTAKILGCVAFVCIIVRVIAERQGFEKAEITYIPTVPNVLYAIFVLVTSIGLYNHARLRPIWQALSPRLRDFWYCTILPIGFWLLIPGNLRAWYKQTFIASPQKVHFWEQLQAVYTSICYEYLFTVPALLFFVLGVVLAILTCRKNKTLCYMTVYALWPVFCMLTSKLAFEARFLGCIFPTLIATSTSGWVQFLSYRKGIIYRFAAFSMLVFIALVHLYEAPQWQQTLQSRARYRYQYAKEEAAFIAAVVAQFDGQSSITISLPEGLWVAPTIRLGLRLQGREVPAKDIIVANDPLSTLVRKQQRLAARGMIIGCEKSPDNLRDLQRLFAGRLLQFSPGPKLPLAGPHIREMLFSKL
jgi:hypothetical protein